MGVFTVVCLTGEIQVAVMLNHESVMQPPPYYVVAIPISVVPTPTDTVPVVEPGSQYLEPWS